MAERGRTKGVSEEESRALLLEVAAKEFAQHGYQGTKVSSIVKKASVSESTFYLHFKNKEAIFGALEDLFRARMFDFVKNSRIEPTLEPVSVRNRIVFNLKSFLMFFLKNHSLTIVGLYISPKSYELMEQFVTQVKGNLDFEVDAGYFRKDLDMELVADSLIGIIERLMFTQLFSQKKDPEVIAEDIVNLLFFGMVAK